MYPIKFCYGFTAYAYIYNHILIARFGTRITTPSPSMPLYYRCSRAIDFPFAQIIPLQSNQLSCRIYTSCNRTNPPFIRINRTIQNENLIAKLGAERLLQVTTL